MQTGRSSGELADRSTRWWFVQVAEEQKAFAFPVDDKRILPMLHIGKLLNLALQIIKF